MPGQINSTLSISKHWNTKYNEQYNDVRHYVLSGKERTESERKASIDESKKEKNQAKADKMALNFAEGASFMVMGEKYIVKNGKDVRI